MLSLKSGLPIAKAIDKEGNIKFLVYVKEDWNEDSPPEIDVPATEKYKLLHDGDIEFLETRFGIGKPELRKIQQAITHEYTDEDAEKYIMKNTLRAFYKAKDLIQNKLKKELDIRSKDNDLTLFPIYDPNEKGDTKNYLGHVYIAAPTGSGKTWFLKDLLVDNAEQHGRKKRTIFFLSRVPKGKDKSLKALKKTYKKKYIHFDLKNFREDDADDSEEEDVHNVESLIEHINEKYSNNDDEPIFFPKMEDFPAGSFIVFDDINTISDSKSGGLEMRDKIRRLQNDLIECGRHQKVSCISTNHLLTNYSETKRLLNECKYFCLFPRAQFNATNQILKNRYGMLERKRVRMLKGVAADGRWGWMHAQAPNYIVSKKRIWIL